MVSLIALLLVGLAYGQKSVNPSSSANNYKHPQVAQKASAQSEANVSLVYVKGDLQASDYKHQAQKYQQGGAVVQNAGSPINYKQNKSGKANVSVESAAPAKESERQLSSAK